MVVTAFDRLGRWLSAAIRTVETVTAARLSLRECIDYSAPTGPMLAGIFTSLAERELELMYERTAAARTDAGLRGRHTARPNGSPRPEPTGPLAAGRGESISDVVTSYCALAGRRDPGYAPWSEAAASRSERSVR